MARHWPKLSRAWSNRPTNWSKPPRMWSNTAWACSTHSKFGRRRSIEVGGRPLADREREKVGHALNLAELAQCWSNLPQSWSMRAQDLAMALPGEVAGLGDRRQSRTQARAQIWSNRPSWEAPGRSCGRRYRSSDAAWEHSARPRPQQPTESHLRPRSGRPPLARRHGTAFVHMAAPEGSALALRPASPSL